MKTMQETFESILRYVEAHETNPIDELLKMGFTPCQLVNIFGVDKERVKSATLYENFARQNKEDLDKFIYPYDLENFVRFDAEWMSFYEANPDQLMAFKQTPRYKELREKYDEEKEPVLAEILTDIFFDETDGGSEDHRRFGSRYISRSLEVMYNLATNIAGDCKDIGEYTDSEIDLLDEVANFINGYQNFDE